MDNELIHSVKHYLTEKYDCHSIILYGSFANGDYTDESDIDLICFCDNPKSNNDMEIFNNRKLDAWIYKTEVMNDCTQFFRVKGGKILLDDRNLCVKFLDDIDKEFRKGPVPLSVDENEFLKNWLLKMLERAKKGDIEGNFRYHWMLVDSLEIYFKIRGTWYLGPKKSIQWMRNNDDLAYDIFDNALKANADIKEVENLVRFIVGL